MVARELSSRSISRHGEKAVDGSLTIEGERQAAAKWQVVRNHTAKSAAQVTRILSAAQSRVQKTARIIADELPHGEDDVGIDASTYNGLLGEAFLGDKNDPASAMAFMGKEMTGDETWGAPAKLQDEVVQTWIDGWYNDQLDQKYRPETLAKKQMRSLLKYAKRLQENPHGISDKLATQAEMAVIGIQQFAITPLLNELSCRTIPSWSAQPWFAEWPSFHWIRDKAYNQQKASFESTIFLEIHFRDEYITLSLAELQQIYTFLVYRLENGTEHPAYESFAGELLRRRANI